MKRLIKGVLTSVSALLMAAAPMAASAQTNNTKVNNKSNETIYSVTPWTYIGKVGDCGTNTTDGSTTFDGGANVVSRWTKDSSLSGNPGPVLYLQKAAPTDDCSSAGATINGVSGLTNLTELNFDYYSGGNNEHCGAGAPRFNVVTTDNVTHFLGCSAGTATTSDTNTGWTHVVFDPTSATQAFPVISSDETISSIDIVFDEQGFVHLDNFSINGTVITNGDTPWAKQQCKHNGYKNFVDLNGTPFRNQGQCVSFVERGQHGMVLGANSNKSDSLTNHGVSSMSNQ